MEKDWTGSAIPSVLKGFTLIGQPIKAEEFKNAFGYEMPEIALNEEEKRRVAQINGLEPAIGYEENQPVAKTEQTALNFGREVLARIKEGDTLQAEQNKQAQQEQQEQGPPLQIEIRGVGNSQTEEDKTETSQTNKDGSGTIGIHDPYTARNLEILKNRNQANQQPPELRQPDRPERKRRQHRRPTRSRRKTPQRLRTAPAGSQPFHQRIRRKNR